MFGNAYILLGNSPKLKTMLEIRELKIMKPNEKKKPSLTLGFFPYRWSLLLNYQIQHICLPSVSYFTSS